MDNYIVYAHTNKANGKKYIGAPHLSLAARSNNGKGYSHQPKFFDDILLYGWDGFSHEILYSGLSRERAEEVERAMIKKYDTIKHGYNGEVGGGIPTLETRIKMSKAKRENPAKYSYKKRPVICLEDMKVFDSISDCARYYNVSTSYMFKLCTHLKRGVQRCEFEGRHFFYAEKIAPLICAVYDFKQAEKNRK